MLEAIIIILVVLWLLGFAVHVGGGLIYILLVLALILFIYRMLTSRTPPYN